MNSIISKNYSNDALLSAYQWIDREVAIMSGRLAEFLTRVMNGKTSSLSSEIDFLNSYQHMTMEGIVVEDVSDILHRLDDMDGHPIASCARAYEFDNDDLGILIFSGLCEHHEGFADVFRSLHPERKEKATIALAAQLLYDGKDRGQLRRKLANGNLTKSGAILLNGDGAYYSNSLVLAKGIWSVFQGVDEWPDEIQRGEQEAVISGLSEWLETDQAIYAKKALQSGQNISIIVSADDIETASSRANALARASDIEFINIEYTQDTIADYARLLNLHARARNLVPVIKIEPNDKPGSDTNHSFDAHTGPYIFCIETGMPCPGGSNPRLMLFTNTLSLAAHTEMWSQELPLYKQDAQVLASRYPVEPAIARQVSQDMKLASNLYDRELELKDISESIRSRVGNIQKAGVKLVKPVAKWDELVLPDKKIQQLNETVDRLSCQAKVLDEWGFLKNKHGSRGVRMLLAGPSGTGKTLSAEVIANALGVDLLIIDISRIVSKWIGETEKNLAEAFSTAERSRSVLMLDECDALLGKRTEISDAHDRYANLETAYLLMRLERFDGLAIMSTNLRDNIDNAFTRRMEFIVEYEEPTREERIDLWRCHIPADAPVADDVNLAELASLYPMSGALIRNASVAAAFVAASEGAEIQRKHFIHAVKREYEKSGRAFPGGSSASRGIRYGGKYNG